MSALNGDAPYFREHNSHFGAYLRELREVRGLSLRDASAQLQISFAKLQKMETGGRFRIERFELFADIADLYLRPRAEVLEAAGIRLLGPHIMLEQHDEETEFALLMLHPDLRPMHMDERWLESFSTLQKKQIVQFAKRLEQFVEADNSLRLILRPPAAQGEE
jgi:transcriptional regulator with XRE-family HTH domain